MTSTPSRGSGIALEPLWGAWKINETPIFERARMGACSGAWRLEQHAVHILRRVSYRRRENNVLNTHAVLCEGQSSFESIQ